MEEKSEIFLKIRNIEKAFGSGDTRQEVLQGVNFFAYKGEICLLLGPLDPASLLY